MAFGAEDEVRGEEGHLQDDKSRCSVNRCAPCPLHRSQKVSSGTILIMGKAPNLNSLMEM